MQNTSLNLIRNPRGAVLIAIPLIAPPILLVTLTLIKMLHTHTGLVRKQQKLDQQVVKTISGLRDQLYQLIAINQRIRNLRQIRMAGWITPELNAALLLEMQTERVLQDGILLSIQITPGVTRTPDTHREPDDVLGPQILTSVSMYEAKINVEIQDPPVISAGELHYEKPVESRENLNPEALLEPSHWRARWSPPVRAKRHFPIFGEPS